jgi:hypothetical protein
VAVDLRGDARIGVPHDPLHGRQIGAGHHEQRRGRVPDVVEADRPHLTDRPQLHLALRAPANLVVGRQHDVAAVLAAAGVSPACQDVRSPERAPQDLFELHSTRQQAAVTSRKDELGLRRGHRDLEVRR